jgi:hypothetical protein
MQSAIQSVSISRERSKGTQWTAYTLGGLAVLFILLDGGMKLFAPQPVVESMTALGYAAELSLTVGIIELLCLALYLIPQTSVLGAILMTGYLGGAVATHLRVGSPFFSLIFPVLLGLMLWAALYLLDSRVRTIIPLQK